MKKILFFEKKKILALLISYVILGGATLFLKSSVMLMLTLMIWIYIMFFCINDIKENIALLLFGISFYVFLLGREVCFSFFGVKRYYTHLEKSNFITYLCLIISMLGIIAGVIFSKYINLKKVDLSKKENYGLDYPKTTLKLIRIMFYICYVAAVICVIMQIVLVRKVGYVASYTSGMNAKIPSVISYMGAFAPTILFIYLATFPNKKNTIISMCIYEVYIILTLLTGKRYPFIAINMLFVIYIIIRNKEEKGWITKKMIYMCIIAVPILIIALSVFDYIRVGKSVNITNVGKLVLNFFDAQGGSINVIKRVDYYKKEIADISFSSLENTRGVIFENIIMRNITDIKIYEGNSLERAVYGNSLAHRLSYISYGKAYLEGRGVGSCFIGELYHDFSYIGVLIGSFFYGFIIDVISRIKFKNAIRDGLLFVTMYYILLAPRGNFDGFIGNICSLYSLFGIFIIYLIMKINNKSIELKGEKK